MRDVSLAPTVVSCNKNEIFSNLKDVRGLDSVKRVSFLVECLDCEFKRREVADRLDVKRTLDSLLSDRNSDLSKHRDVMNHVFDENVRQVNVKRLRGIYELNCAKRLRS